MIPRGRVEPGFEAVRDAFVANFELRGEIGAAFSVWRGGKPVVQLYGGVSDPASGRAWGPDTAGVLFSATKGLVATAFLMLVDRGECDLDAPVSTWWPAFAAPDKAGITVRMLLNHRSGLSVLDAPLRLGDFAPPGTAVVEAMEAQAPVFSPDSQQAYGATAWGAYTGALFARITGVSLGDWLHQELVEPLELTLSLGARSVSCSDRATLVPVSAKALLTEQIPHALFAGTPEARLFRQVLRGVVGGSTLPARALLNPTLGPQRFRALNDPAVLALELPWMNALASADALAKVYAALVSEVGGFRLVRPDALAPLGPRQTWAAQGDPVLCKPMGWSQGFVKEESSLFSPNATSFGHPGAGGVLGWADPTEALSVGYVMNRMDWRLRSPRALALTRAVYACL